jgi:hypothetical protein
MAAANTYLYTWYAQTPTGYTGVLNGQGYPTGSIGTRLLMISTTVPISNIFYLAYHGQKAGFGTVTQTLPGGAYSNNDAGAVATDINVISRSVKMDPIHLGAGQIIQGVDIIEDIGGWLQGRLVPTR